MNASECVTAAGKIMKLLSINSMFVLPPDFNGGLPAALRELAAYLETNPPANLGETPITLTLQDIANKMPEVIEQGKKFYGATSLAYGGFYDGWTILEPPPLAKD